MTEMDSMLTVGRAAAMVGVSVRTLHHWEQIGLVVASGRTWSDDRLYDAGDIARIHRVLVYRELGLPLAEIGRILDDPTVDPVEHLMLQRDLVAARRQGVFPGDPEATELASRHRESIGRYYLCTRSRQVILARLYTEDPRFTAHYDVDEPGLAGWLRSVIEADARAHDVDPDTAGWDD